jgi:hypothetical protein
MCTVLLPPVVNPIAVKYIISYLIYHIIYHIYHNIYHISYRIIYHIPYIMSYHISYHISYTIYHINNVERSRPQMTIWRMRIGCWTTKATNTLRICNNYCFSTATMVLRTRLSYVIRTLPVLLVSILMFF